MPFLFLPQAPAVIHLKGLTPRERTELFRGLSNLNPSFAPPQVWDGGRLFDTGEQGIKELDQVQPPLRFEQPPRDLAWHFTFDVVDGAAYAWGWGEDWASGQKGRDVQELRRTLYIYRNAGARWELWDTLTSTRAAFIRWMRPLEGGGYLLGGAFQDEVGNRCDPLAIAKNSGHGKMQIHDTEDVELGAPTFVWGEPQEPLAASESQRENYNRPRWMYNRALLGVLDAMAGAFTHPIRVPGHMVLVGRHLGFFIVINARTGKVERTARLYTDLPEDAMRDPAGYEFAVLGAQPRSDGHLLIAARSETAVRQSRTWNPDLPAPAPVRLSASEAFGKSAEEQGEALEAKQDALDQAHAQEAQEARLRHFPDLVWWDFDPDTGAFRREPTPMGVPERFPSVTALRAFHFSFKGDGNLAIEPKVWK